jgi:hypothetical protein
LGEGGSKGRHGNKERVSGGRKRDEEEGGRGKQEKGKERRGKRKNADLGWVGEGSN